MQVNQICRNYFNLSKAIQDVRHPQDIKTTAVALAKIFSYLTLIIPLGVGIAYGISYLCNLCLQRFKKDDITSVNKQADKLIDSLRNIREGDESHMKPTLVTRSCEVARRYLEEGNMQKAVYYKELAVECANSNEERMFEHLQHLLAIARLEHQFPEGEQEMNASVLDAALDKLYVWDEEDGSKSVIYKDFTTFLCEIGREKEADQLVAFELIVEPEARAQFLRQIGREKAAAYYEAIVEAQEAAA